MRNCLKLAVCLVCLVVFISRYVPCSADETTESSSGVPAAGSQQLQGFNLNGYDNAGNKTWNVNGSKADIWRT